MSYENLSGDGGRMVEELVMSLGRTGRNMENALRYERQMRERNRLIRYAQPLPEPEIKPRIILSNYDYEMEVIRKASSMEAAADTVIHDAKRGVIIGGRRAAAVAVCLLLFRWVATSEEEQTEQNWQPTPVDGREYSGSAPSSPVPMEGVSPTDLQLPQGTAQHPHPH